MTKPNIEIIRISPGNARVLVNGEQLPGVRTVTYTEDLRKPPTVTVTLVARSVSVRERALGHGER